jgi:hypothetical protein
MVLFHHILPVNTKIMNSQEELIETKQLNLNESRIKQLDQEIASLKRQLRSTIRLIDDNTIRTRNTLQTTKFFICYCFILLAMLYQPKQSTIDFAHFIFFQDSAQKDMPMNISKDSI